MKLKSASLAVAILFALVAVAHAQSAGQPRIRRIAVRHIGPGILNEDYVRAQIETKEGDPLDVLALSRDIQTLMKTGRFADVQVRQERADDGLGLVYEITTNYRLAKPIVIEGASALSESRIQDSLKLSVGDYIGDDILGAAAARVLQEYGQRRYASARIEWDMVPLDAAMGTALVTLRVREGERSFLRAVRFEGSRLVPDSELQSAIAWPSMWNPFNWFSRKPFDEYELTTALQQITERYLDEGYLDVGIDEPEMFVDGDGGVTAVVRIREGEAYTVGTMSLSGVSGNLFAESVLLDLIDGTTLRPGVVAGMAPISAAARAVQDHYQNAGHSDTRVRPSLQTNPEARTVDIVFVVAEGGPVTIGNVHIRGNSRTRDKVIRRELIVAPGDDYIDSRIERSERRLKNLGFFSSVRSYGIDVEPGVRDVYFEVEEQRTGQFMAGAGFSSIDNIMGFLEIQQGNFDLLGWPYLTGGGQKARLRAQFGSTQTDYRFSFTEPWFLDRQLSFSTDIYHTKLNYPNYDLERLGVSFGLGMPLAYATRLHLEYRLEDEKITDVDADHTYYYEFDPTRAYTFTVDEDHTKSSFSTMIAFDRRDNSRAPTRGQRVSLRGTLTGGPLGFDMDIYELEVRGAQFFTLHPGHVLSLQGSATTVDAYGATEEVPLSDKLYAGGPRTIRGFRFRDVGPKVFRIDRYGRHHVRTIGGQTRALTSAEYTIRLHTMFRFAGFYDIGGVWSDPFDADFGTLASSYGIGLRLDLPGFPMRLDYAWPLDRDSEMTRTDRWSISIGYDF